MSWSMNTLVTALSAEARSLFSQEASEFPSFISLLGLDFLGPGTLIGQVCQVPLLGTEEVWPLWKPHLTKGHDFQRVWPLGETGTGVGQPWKTTGDSCHQNHLEDGHGILCHLEWGECELWSQVPWLLPSMLCQRVRDPSFSQLHSIPVCKFNTAF